MLIIKMIRRITNLNQDELANMLNVSRASINTWENSNGNMTTYQKNIISEKFNIPIELIDDDINDDVEKCKKLYLFISARWNEINSQETLLSDDDILNKVELEIKKDEIKNDISDNDIIDALTNGYDPYTGEVYDNTHILNDPQVKQFLINIKQKYYKHGSTISKADLDIEQKKTFKELQKWRKDMTTKEGYFSAYMVFTDKELINIITSNTKKKEDLLTIKGIADYKYTKYGDDIFYILKTGKYDFDIGYIG